MTTQLSDKEVTALVAQSLKQYALKTVPLPLNDDQASDCRKRIIELIGLDRPKSIVHAEL